MVDRVLSLSARMDAAHLRPSCSDFFSEDVHTGMSALFSCRRPSPGFAALLAPAAADDRHVCSKRWDLPAGRVSAVARRYLAADSGSVAPGKYSACRYEGPLVEGHKLSTYVRRRVAGVATRAAVRSEGTLAVSTTDQFLEIKMTS